MASIFGSSYKKLLAEEKTLPRPNGMVTMDTFNQIVAERADFAKKIENAYKKGKLNDSQYQELLTTNRRNALPG